MLLLSENSCESLKHETDDDPKGLSVVKMCHPPAPLPPTCWPIFSAKIVFLFYFIWAPPTNFPFSRCSTNNFPHPRHALSLPMRKLISFVKVRERKFSREKERNIWWEKNGKLSANSIFSEASLVSRWLLVRRFSAVDVFPNDAYEKWKLSQLSHCFVFPRPGSRLARWKANKAFPHFGKSDYATSYSRTLTIYNREKRFSLYGFGIKAIVESQM